MRLCLKYQICYISANLCSAVNLIYHTNMYSVKNIEYRKARQIVYEQRQKNHPRLERELETYQTEENSAVAERKTKVSPEEIVRGLHDWREEG